MEGEIGCNVALEKFEGHVAVVVEEADMGGGGTENFSIGVGCEKPEGPGPPFACANAVEFVEIDIVEAF